MTSELVYEQSRLQARIMDLYCPWFGTFTTNPADTLEKAGYWAQVRMMSMDELIALLPADEQR